MFKLSYYVFGFENKYCCLFLINKGTLLYDQPSYLNFFSSQDGVVLIWLLAGRSSVRIPIIEILFSQTSRPALGLTWPPFQWVPGLFLGDKVVEA